MAVTGVLQFYRTVIEDVLNNVRETFLDDGIDEQVLTELKQIWESKLVQSKAVPAEHAHPEPSQPPAAVVAVAAQHQQVAMPVSLPAASQSVTLAQTMAGVVHQPVQYYTTTASGGQTGNDASKTVTFTLPQLAGAGMKPVTITLPAHGMQHAGPTGIVMSSPAAAAAQALPANMTAGLLQPLSINAQGLLTQQQPDGTTVSFQTVTAEQLAKQGYVLANMTTPTTTAAHQQMNTIQVASMRQFQTQQAAADQQQKNKQSGVIQLDGANDSSDDDDDDDDMRDDDNDLDDDDDNEVEADAIGEEEEPLNSEDDVSDEDASELFDTDNVIVCQYDKITRARNKWKFHLKDGIMNVQGKDYVFQKASGDAEW